jgi:hypothetical protein
MSIQDKYNILPKKIGRKNTNEIIGEYLDCVIQDMVGTYSKEYIHHLIWLEKDNLNIIEIINRKLEVFFDCKSRYIKRKLRVNNLSFSSNFIPIIKGCIKVMQNLNRTFILINKNFSKNPHNAYRFPWGKSFLIDNGLTMLSNKIFDIPIVISFMENQFQDTTPENKSVFKDFFDIINKIGIYHENIKIWFVKLLENSIRNKNIVFSSGYKKNIFNVYSFVKRVEYISFINFYFSFVKDSLTGLTLTFINDIIRDIMEIFKNDNKVPLHFIETKKQDISYFLKLLDKNKERVTLTKENISVILDYLSNILKKIEISDANYSFKDYVNVYLFCKKIQNKISKSTATLIDACLKEVVSKCNYNLTEYVVNYFDSLIVDLNIKKSKPSISEHLFRDFVEDINSLVEIAFLLPEKDKTIALYLNKLKKRMLSNLSVEIELIVVSVLEIYYPAKLIVNINRMIDDKKQNDLDNINFHQVRMGSYEPDILLSLRKNIFVFCISYGVWNIDLTHGKIFPSQINHPDFPQKFKPYLLSHCKFYEQNHKPKSIYYYAQMGEVIMSRKVNGININVKMLPLQGLLLDDLIKLHNKFGIDKTILMDRIFWREYEEDYRLNILKSFVIEGIVEKNGNKYNLSNSWNPESENIDLIKIFYDLSKYKQEVVVKLNSVLAFDRKKTITAIINHLLKKSNLSKNILYNNVVEKCNVFNVSHELFESTIEIMKEKTYLVESDNMFIKAVF